MQNVHFTVDDVARLKIMSTVGAAAEAVFAAEVLKRGAGGAPLARWRDTVGPRLNRLQPDFPRRAARPAKPSQLGRRPDDTWLFDLMADGTDTTPSPMARKVYQLGIAPYWERMRAYLQLDREFRYRELVGGGIERVLTTLHTWVGWQQPVLTIACGREQQIHLRGRGLVIAPSVFVDRPTVFTDPRADGGAPLLIYPVVLDKAASNALWNVVGTTDRALAALVGRTRAKVLLALGETCNTSELGRKLGISPAAASQHATVLRDAGLVTSRRRFNTMLHSLTPLGSALVTGGRVPAEGLDDNIHYLGGQPA
jgi:DNA-binding transcriptional ArsR family regulator